MACGRSGYGQFKEKRIQGQFSSNGVTRSNLCVNQALLVGAWRGGTGKSPQENTTALRGRKKGVDMAEVVGKNAFAAHVPQEGGRGRGIDMPSRCPAGE